MASDYDQSLILQECVLAAIAAKSPLNITGGGSKGFYGYPPTAAKPLCVAQHRGIINYQPSELVVTARVGTTLRELETILAEQRQMLAFEPPHFGETATLGGAIACGFSGPRRPFTGSARDFVLGCRIISGQGEILRFGGEVMKNVAGFDVSRLMAGALGTLGVLLDVSLKVLPCPQHEQTLVFTLDAKAALATMLAWQRQCLPLSALCYVQGLLYVRLSGTEAAVAAAAKQLGGAVLEADGGFWQAVREQQHEFFRAEDDLWRLSVPAASPPLALSGECLYDWGGGLRWLKTTELSSIIFAAAAEHGGHATLFRGRNRSDVFMQPLPDNMRQLQQRVKQAFDPRGILNPGRLYAEW